MARRLAWVFSLLLLATATAQDAIPRLTVSYAVDATNPESGKIKVVMTVRHNVDDEVKVAIPAWAPGAYRIVKYSRQVWNVQASGKDGKKLEVDTVDDQTWKVKTGGTERFAVSYELTVERSRMDKDHLFIAGPDTYFYIVNRKDTPCSVAFSLPEGWKVGTGLDADGAMYRARDYDTFIDCPTELGKFELLSFEADNATFDIVIHSKGPVDGTKIVDMCKRIVVNQNQMFGGPPPFKRYVFLYHFKDQTGGRGLEHLNSTDISMPYAAIKFDPYLAASVTSHEYFHLWNVKRIRPAELGPFDYTGIVRSKALWMCEGVTSYYGDRTLAHCGIWKEQQYLDHVAGEIETLQNNPDRKVTSVEKASQSVWDRKDYPRVDYYNKGELLGLLIDLKIRTATDVRGGSFEGGAGTDRRGVSRGRDPEGAERGLGLGLEAVLRGLHQRRGGAALQGSHGGGRAGADDRGDRPGRPGARPAGHVRGVRVGGGRGGQGGDQAGRPAQLGQRGRGDAGEPPGDGGQAGSGRGGEAPVPAGGREVRRGDHAQAEAADDLQSAPGRESDRSPEASPRRLARQGARVLNGTINQVNNGHFHRFHPG
jgi:hypothetical protein